MKLGFVKDEKMAKYYLNGGDAFRLKLWINNELTPVQYRAHQEKYLDDTYQEEQQQERENVSSEVETVATANNKTTEKLGSEIESLVVS